MMYVSLMGLFLASLTTVMAVIYCRAFLPFWSDADTTMRYLARSVVMLSALLALRSAFLDAGMPVYWALHGRPVTEMFDSSRIIFVTLYHLGLTYAAFSLGKVLQATIPEAERTDWPWWRAPFYPKRYIFW